MRECDVIIIGTGPGGMDAAALALKAGLDTVVIERDLLGGTCLNRGCIPTKALCRSAAVVHDVRNSAAFGVDIPSFSLNYAAAASRKDEIVAQLRENVSLLLQKAEIVKGEARFVSSHVLEVDGEQYTAPKIIIATGSKCASLPIEGADLTIDSDVLLSMTALPRSMCIIGGGVIGMEFASILAAFGVEVTVVEYCKEILPNFDKDIAKRLRMALTKQGVKIITQAQVTAVKPGKTVEYTAKGKPSEIVAEEVLMAVGRRPIVPDGAQEAGIELNRGAIKVNEEFMTSVPGVYAIGDVNASLMLAHVASAQAVAVMGHRKNLEAVPAAVFTQPECAMVGLTEDICKERGLNVVTSKALFRGNGKAVAMGETDGIAKIIVDADSRKLLGAHICGPHAADLIQEITVAMVAGCTVDDIKRTIHGHPTLGEVVAAACEML